jgi:hypothetical protein
MVDDTVRGRGRQGRWADTAVPIRYDQKAAAAYCEIKHVAYASKSKSKEDVAKHVAAAARACATDSGVPEGSVFAFLSVHATKLEAADVEGLRKQKFGNVESVPEKATKKPLRATFTVTNDAGRVVFFALVELSEIHTTFRFDRLREAIDTGRAGPTSWTLDGIIKKLAPSRVE